MNVTNRDNPGAPERDDLLAAWSGFIAEHQAEIVSAHARAEDLADPGPGTVAWIAITPAGTTMGSGPTAGAARIAAVRGVLDRLVSPAAAYEWFGDGPPSSLSGLLPSLEIIRLEGPAAMVAALVQRLERIS